MPKKATIESYAWGVVKPNETETALRLYTTFHNIYCAPIIHSKGNMKLFSQTAEKVNIFGHIDLDFNCFD